MPSAASSPCNNEPANAHCSGISTSISTASTVATHVTDGSLSDPHAAEGKVVAMEIDEAFHGDPSGFSMAFDELADGNQADQLYPELTVSPRTHADNQREHQQHSTSHGMHSEECSLEETPSPSRTVPTSNTLDQGTDILPQNDTVCTAPPPHNTTQRAPASQGFQTRKLVPTAASKRPIAAANPTQAFSWNDILRVQNLIERCLQQYLSKVRAGAREGES
jgi:hypothetical protein